MYDLKFLFNLNCTDFYKSIINSFNKEVKIYFETKIVKSCVMLY